MGNLPPAAASPSQRWPQSAGYLQRELHELVQEENDDQERGNE